MEKLLAENLGNVGNIVGFSKSGYVERNPKNLVIFNSNLCTKEDGKVWFGDLDVTKKKEELIKISQTLGKELYVLFEMDGRFENENKPLLHRYVVKFNPNGEYELRKNIEKYYTL